MESFVVDMDGKNVVIMDNASVHNIPESKLLEWSKKGLEIVKLTPYSPELNIIEILWRFIKYKWLELSAYGSYKSLVESVCNILALVGVNYEINFAQVLNIDPNMFSPEDNKFKTMSNKNNSIVFTKDFNY